MNGADLYQSDLSNPSSGTDPSGLFFFYLITSGEDDRLDGARQIADAIGGKMGATVGWIMHRAIVTADRAVADSDALRQGYCVPVETAYHTYKDFQADLRRGKKWYVAAPRAALKNGPTITSLLWQGAETIHGSGIDGRTDGIAFSFGTRLDMGIDVTSNLAGLTIGALSEGGVSAPMETPVIPKLGDMITGVPVSAMFHMSPASVGALEPGSAWVQMGDIKHLTLTQYRAGVVGDVAAGGQPCASVAAIKLLNDSSAPLFAKNPTPNFAGVQEWRSKSVVVPDVVVDLNRLPPLPPGSLTQTPPLPPGSLNRTGG